MNRNREYGRGPEEKKILDHAIRPEHYGTLDRPDGAAAVRAGCGDTVMMFLRTARRRVEEVRFVTDGCIYTLAACSVAAELAEGRSLGECLGMRADDILGCLRDMPEDHRHCAEIAVLTLRKAVRNSLIRGSGDWKRAYRPITKP